MSDKFTPGPYRASNAMLTHSHPERFWQVPVFSGNNIVAYACGATQEEAEANARLIAAAPELPAACEALRQAALDMRGDFVVHSHIFSTTLERAFAADDLAQASLSKVRGEQ